MTPRVIGEAYGLDRRQHFSSLLGQVQMRRLPGLTTQFSSGCSSPDQA